MKERLIQQRERLVQQIAAIDRSIKFFDEHPEMEHVLNALGALNGMPLAPINLGF